MTCEGFLGSGKTVGRVRDEKDRSVRLVGMVVSWSRYIPGRSFDLELSLSRAFSLELSGLPFMCT